MTLQEIYDFAVDHLDRQGGPALAKKKIDSGSYDNLCRYRTEDGKKCAIGCFIPDEDYRPEFETVLAENLGYIPPVFRGEYEGWASLEHLELACRLQSVHDDCRTLESLNEALAFIARYFHIEPKQVRNWQWPTESTT